MPVVSVSVSAVRESSRCLMRGWIQRAFGIVEQHLGLLHVGASKRTTPRSPGESLPRSRRVPRDKWPARPFPGSCRHVCRRNTRVRQLAVGGIGRPVMRMNASSSSGLSGSPIVANKRERQACQEGPAKAVPSREGSSRAWRSETLGVMGFSVGTVALCASFLRQPSPGCWEAPQEWLGPVLHVTRHTSCSAGPLCWNKPPSTPVG